MLKELQVSILTCEALAFRLAFWCGFDEEILHVVKIKIISSRNIFHPIN